jgi:hypothetical protein
MTAFHIVATGRAKTAEFAAITRESRAFVFELNGRRK